MKSIEHLLCGCSVTIDGDAVGLGDSFAAMLFYETIGKVKPELVIPVHWDNFFSKLKGQKYFMPTVFEKTNKSLYLLADYCGKQGIDCVVQLPLSSFQI